MEITHQNFEMYFSCIQQVIQINVITTIKLFVALQKCNSAQINNTITQISQIWYPKIYVQGYFQRKADKKIRIGLSV